MSATQIKFCGLTRKRDVDKALELGVNYLGFVLADSPRQVTLKQLAKLCVSVPAHIKKVGVFANVLSEEPLAHVLDKHLLDFVQIHGACPPFTRMAFDRVILAHRVKPGLDASVFQSSQKYFGTLLDAFVDGTMGGTGQCFDWSLIPYEHIQNTFFLAGGLRPENVGDAVAHVHPHVVDVSSGIELCPGLKDHDQMERFVAAVKKADMA